MKAPARSHAKVFSASGTPIGEITSGGFGPSCNKAIAMGYVTSEHATEGTEVNIQIRDKMYPAKVCHIVYLWVILFIYFYYNRLQKCHFIQQITLNLFKYYKLHTFANSSYTFDIHK